MSLKQECFYDVRWLVFIFRIKQKFNMKDETWLL